MEETEQLKKLEQFLNHCSKEEIVNIYDSIVLKTISHLEKSN